MFELVCDSKGFRHGACQHPGTLTFQYSELHKSSTIPDPPGADWVGLRHRSGDDAAHALDSGDATAGQLLWWLDHFKGGWSIQGHPGLTILVNGLL